MLFNSYFTLLTACFATVSAQNLVNLGTILSANIISGGSALISPNVLANVLGPSQCSTTSLVGINKGLNIFNLFSTCVCVEVANTGNAKPCPSCPSNASPICASATCACECDIGYYSAGGKCVPTTSCSAPNILQSLDNGHSVCQCARGFVSDLLGGCLSACLV